MNGVIMPTNPPFEPMLPDLNTSLGNMSKKEALKYFNWYLAHQQERISYLSAFSGVVLDFSEQSLVNLWAWYLGVVRVEKVMSDEKASTRSLLAGLSEELIDLCIDVNPTKLSSQSLQILWDIQRYFAEFFVHNHKKLRWVCQNTRKSDIYFNHPQIVGNFDNDRPSKITYVIVPEVEINAPMAHILDGERIEDDLLNQYLEHKQYLL
jgi:hypothetical protein